MTVRSQGGVRSKTGEKTTQKTPAKKDEIPTAVRAEVLSRDSGRCRWCGTRTVHLHHICYRSEGVDHSPHNLITLCPHHHDVVHADKRRWKPILLALIWIVYVERRHTTVPLVEKVLARG